MKFKSLFLTFCLVSGISGAYAANKPKTADSQVLGTSYDVEVTRKIRESLTSDESLSSAAQNVTIVTVGNTITLRGEVKKQDEITKITNAAQQVAAGKTINNELRVTR